jgi:hypothetical protein
MHATTREAESSATTFRDPRMSSVRDKLPLSFVAESLEAVDRRPQRLNMLNPEGN